MALSAEQRGVLRGIITALAIVAVAFSALLWLVDGGVPASGGLSRRLAFVAGWDLLVVGSLLAGVVMLARHRFFHDEDRDGSGLTPGSKHAEVLQAILQNSLEQTVLALSVHGIAAILFPAPWLVLIAGAAVLFVLGRILFWHGYAKGAVGRALGFGLTFYPTVTLFVLAAISAFDRL